MNSELCKKAMEMVGNPNVLVNLVSRRVRQLNSPGGAMSRPLIETPPGMGTADIALLEIVEGKITFESPEPVEVLKAPTKRRKRASS